MKRVVIGIAISALAALAGGCKIGGDVSGWELVPDRAWTMQLENFPDIPVTFQEPARRAPTPALRSPIYATFVDQLDRGSLFRRGYSAPTP